MKAIVLFSGGLDSTLAARLMKEEGIELIALNFKTPFCLCDRKSSSGCSSHARQTAGALGIEFEVVNVTEDFLKVVENPKHGRGSNMNPCIDCRILKFRKAKELMHESDARFIITGEVLGQRPMSQHRKALGLIEKEAGLEGLVLRPLSAKLLPETTPEKERWVSRERLLNFSGRTRKPQIELAKAFDIKDYPCPAGGCLLTDPAFSRRVKDLIEHGELNIDNVELLKLGRHFRITPSAKLVVGRDEKENERLFNTAKAGDHLFFPGEKLAGPTALGRGAFNNDLINFSAGIVSYYCDLDDKKEADIIYKKAGVIPERASSLVVTVPEDNDFARLRL